MVDYVANRNSLVARDRMVATRMINFSSAKKQKIVKKTGKVMDASGALRLKQAFVVNKQDVAAVAEK